MFSRDNFAKYDAMCLLILTYYNILRVVLAFSFYEWVGRKPGWQSIVISCP